MVERARATNRVLMVGYMKRYDPAYERLADEMPQLGALRHSRLTTQESPLDGYVAHYPLRMASDIPIDDDRPACRPTTPHASGRPSDRSTRRSPAYTASGSSTA